MLLVMFYMISGNKYTKKFNADGNKDTDICVCGKIALCVFILYNHVHLDVHIVNIA